MNPPPEGGVRYALDPAGRVADPETAPRLERAYRCLVCGEHVHVRRGRVRAAHFAHYAEREVACNPETVLHEAAKHRLVEMLEQGVKEFGLLVGCPGYINRYERRAACPEEGLTKKALPVPTGIDAAGVEVPFGAYRLDAAALRAGEVVLGLEVFHSHAVDDAKREHLMGSGVPWFEVEAGVVLGEPMPWLALRSSYGAVQCAACRERERAEELARQREAEARRREQERRRELAERQALFARAVPVARDGRRAVTARGRRPGDTLTCLVCRRPVTSTRVDGKMVFLHAPGERCDAARAWTRAGMLAVYQQLKRAPEAVRIYRRCSGSGLTECREVIVDRPPAFDEVRGEEPALLLLKGGRVVAQLVFGRDPPDAGPAPRLWLKPGKAVHKPTVWWQRRDGRRCPECELRAQAEEAEAARRAEEARAEQERALRAAQREAEQQRAAAERLAAEARLAAERERAERERREEAAFAAEVPRWVAGGDSPLTPADAGQREWGLTLARAYFKNHGIDPAWAAGLGVVARRCEHCHFFVAFLLTHALEEIPAGAEGFLGRHPSGGIRNRCGYCGRLASNAHLLHSEGDRLVFLSPTDLRGPVPRRA